jgi:hypothetical protein
MDLINELDPRPPSPVLPPTASAPRHPTSCRWLEFESPPPSFSADSPPSPSPSPSPNDSSSPNFSGTSAPLKELSNDDEAYFRDRLFESFGIRSPVAGPLIAMLKDVRRRICASLRPGDWDFGCEELKLLGCALATIQFLKDSRREAAKDLTMLLKVLFEGIEMSPRATCICEALENLDESGDTTKICRQIGNWIQIDKRWEEKKGEKNEL